MAKRKRPGARVLRNGPGVRAQFLEYLANGLTPRAAARKTGVTTQSILEWRRADPAFAREWRDAFDFGTDKLDAEACERALDRSDKESARLLIAQIRSRATRWLPPPVSHGEAADAIVPEIEQPIDERELWRRVQFLMERAKRGEG